jgi:hypothetical protein
VEEIIFHRQNPSPTFFSEHKKIYLEIANISSSRKKPCGKQFDVTRLTW